MPVENNGHIWMRRQIYPPRYFPGLISERGEVQDTARGQLFLLPIRRGCFLDVHF